MSFTQAWCVIRTLEKGGKTVNLSGVENLQSCPPPTQTLSVVGFMSAIVCVYQCHLFWGVHRNLDFSGHLICLKDPDNVFIHVKEPKNMSNIRRRIALQYFYTIFFKTEDSRCEDSYILLYILPTSFGRNLFRKIPTF